MKLPGLRLNLEGVGGFLLRHGEKLVGALALVGAALLVWSGIDAVRGKGVREEQLPSAIERQAQQADSHVGRVKQAPADFLAAHDPLSERLDAWRSPLPPWRATAALELADPPQVSLLDKPVFEELAKRTKPDVFPVEELHAAAGIALVATKPPAGGREGDQAAAGSSGRLAAYVIVTGLVPARKQQDEYRGRFQSVGYKDAKRDSPLWSDFELERTAVVPGVAEKWEPIDLAAAARSGARDWGAVDPGQPPQGWVLEQTTPVPFFGPLPQRLDGGWGLDDLHPRLVERLASLPDAEGVQPPESRPEPAPAAVGPGFGDLPTEPEPAADRPEQPVATGPPFRLIRFIDMGVEPDRSYKYRARLKVWNPNLGLAPQHVADPGLTGDQKLASPPSAASNTVRVPGTTRILAGTLSKDDAKRLRLKPGTYEMLVLAPTATGDGYSLRAVYGETGSIADVDPKAPKPPGEVRSRGEPVVTGRMLVDARGRQEDRDAVPTGRGGRKPDRELVPEPLEMICLRPDGSFEFVSAADAARDVARYADTLPSLDGGPRRTAPAEDQSVPDDPFLTSPAGSRR